MSLKKLFQVKSLDQILVDAEKPEYRLNRALGPVHLIMLGIGAIIGAGIFATIGTAAAGDAYRPGAGPALMISFIITAVVCGFTALCYAEFASMVPISGSAYTYSYVTLGEIVAWIIGWDLIIEYAVGNIAVAISWANYFKTLLRGLGVIIPDWLSMDYRTAARIVDAAGQSTVFRDAPHVFGIPIVFNLLAVLIVAAISVVLVTGIRGSARFNAIMVGIKILVLSFFIVVGLKWVQPENWAPFAPNGWAGISAGAAIVFFAYIGFDAVSTVAEETRNPKRNLPIGIIGSLILCTFFYVIVSAVFTGLISYPDLRTKLATEQAEPLTMALEHAIPHLGWAVGIVALGSVIAHTAVLLVFQMGQPRIFFSMARDGLLPAMFQKVHPRFRTPHVATLMTGAFVAFFSAIASIDEMVDLTNIGTLFAFILVCSGIIVLRKRDPERARSFRVPGGWGWTIGLYIAFALGLSLFAFSIPTKLIILGVTAVVFVLARNYIFPVLGIISCLYLIYYLPPTSWLRFAAWLNFGFVIYAGYGVIHSRLRGRAVSEEPAAHDRYTALTGAILGLVGTVLLLVTRGLDIIMVAFQAIRGPEGWARFQEAASHIQSLDAWLQSSWFLTAPLMLNTFVLGPLSLRRAWRSRQAETPGAGWSSGTLAIGLSLLLLALGTAYLIAMLVHSTA
ncbi:MAG TPA: amino acid permease [Acidobacteriota bacterium]|nr:amino acid permease [Acidobacteriota bacterium]HQM61743.1 amino acid permease [Acidobacteriota bacterium]